jgi:hypothetical protein
VVDNEYPDPPLPVTLTIFEARQQAGSARLSWQTATETNNLGFEIQGSVNAREFVKLGFVNSQQGNSIQAQNYTFLDAAFSFRNDPVYYYRLKQIDVDGSAKYSKIVALHQVPREALVLPIPFNENFSVHAVSLQKGQTEVILLDMHGNMVYRQAFPVQEGVNTLQVQPPASLPPGMYIIQFETKGKTVRIKTLKD